MIYGRWNTTGPHEIDAEGRISLTGYELLDYKVSALGQSPLGEEDNSAIPVVINPGHADVRFRLVLSAKRESP